MQQKQDERNTIKKHWGCIKNIRFFFLNSQDMNVFETFVIIYIWYLSMILAFLKVLEGWGMGYLYFAFESIILDN